jgi:hypothetical protein
LRAVIEEPLSTEGEYEVLVGDAVVGRKVSVAWSQEETDGQIVGLKYLDVDASVPAPDTSTPPGEE